MTFMTHGTYTQCPTCGGHDLQNIVEEATGCNETFCHDCNEFCYKTFQYQMRKNPAHMEAEMSIVLCKDCYTKYPVQDDQWPSRRWNADRTDHIDLSGCPDPSLCKGCGKKIVHRPYGRSGQPFEEPSARELDQNPLQHNRGQATPRRGAKNCKHKIKVK